MSDTKIAANLDISRIQDRLLQARSAMVNHQYDVALTAIEEVLVVDPTNNEALCMAMELGERDEQARLEEMERAQPLTSALSTEERPPHTREEQLPSNVLNGILLIARRYLERKKLELALDEVNAGLIIDACHPELLWLRNTIIEQMELRELQRTQERRAMLLLCVREFYTKTEFEQAQESVTHALEEFPNDGELLSLAAEIEEARTNWEMAKRSEQSEIEMGEHAKRARQFLRTECIDDAIQEITLGLLLDPQNHAMKKLEGELWIALEQKETAQRHEETRKANEREFAKVTIHLVAAQEFLMYGQFSRALDEIAHAYVLDPLNQEIKQLELRIRSQQKRTIAAPLKLIYNGASTQSQPLKQNHS